MAAFKYYVMIIVKIGNCKGSERIMKFAFLIIGSFNSKIDKATIHEGMAQIVGVANIEEACTVAKKL